MTETTNPPPGDPSGPTALPEDSALADGSSQLGDAGSTGTDDGPGGIPAALAGVDSDGDPVDPPPAAQPGDLTTSTGPAETADLQSPSDTSSPLSGSSSRGETAAPSQLPGERGGR